MKTLGSLAHPDALAVAVANVALPRNDLSQGSISTGRLLASPNLDLVWFALMGALLHWLWW